MSNNIAEVSQASVMEQPVPAGYKQTDAGIIPEDWNHLSFGDALTIRHGRNQKEVEATSGKYPIFGTGGQMGWANEYLCDQPSVLIGRKGSINKPRYIDQPFWTVDTLFYSEIKEDFNPKYIYYQFCTIDWMLHNEASGVPSLNASTIEKVFSLFPPYKEQTAIAKILSDVDVLLDSLEALIAKKQAIKTATMQQLLTGRTRLSQFAHHPDGSKKGYKQSELGEIPEDWGVLPFGLLAKPNSTRINPKLYDGGDFCIELEHISQGGGYLTGSTQTSSTSSLKSVFEEGDVLFGKLRAYLKKYWLARKSGVCSTEIWVLRAEQQKSISGFVFFVVQTDRFIEEASEAYGTHMPRSDWKVVSELPIATPSIEEQTAIATILSDMDEELQALEQQLSKTRQLKQGMMQQLLTGKVRLPVASAS